MKKLLALAALSALAGCDFLPGGGGGTNTPSFAKGYIFVRRDDRNVYAADETKLDSPLALTAEGGARHPSLSKDGKRVVFSRTVGNETEIAVVSTSGGIVSRVVAASAISMAARNLRQPVFSPDGIRIVFAFDEGAGSSLAVVNGDGSGLARLTPQGAFSYSSPSFTPDGTAVLAAVGSSTTAYLQLEMVTLATGASMNVVSTLGNEAVQGVANRVVLSPDGTKATFDARLGSGSTRIFVLNMSTKAITRLTDYPGNAGANDSFPSWAGAKVTFSSDAGGNDTVCALDATLTNTSGGVQLPSALEPWFGPN